MDLTPAQRDRIRQLLEEELREAYRSAVEGGASPAAVGEALSDRRQALEELTGEPADEGDAERG
jgi:hypothetical protein